MDESILIKRAKKGNEQAFEAIVRLYEVRAYTYAYHLIGNREDAQEITQDSFVKLWNGLPNFREDASLSTYLMRIVKNTCLDFLRKRKETVLPLQDISADGETYDRAIPDLDPEHDPVEALERKEKILTVQKAVAELSPDFREILLLRDFHHMSYEEIGAVLGLEDGTVRSRLNRARMKLKKILEEWNFSI